jgi:hypothetical protein
MSMILQALREAILLLSAIKGTEESKRLSGE